MIGRASECESLYRQALALCPTYPSAHYNLGVLASESRRWLDALQHYKDTLALAPHHAQVRDSVSACVMRTRVFLYVYMYMYVCLRVFVRAHVRAYVCPGVRGTLVFARQGLP